MSKDTPTTTTKTTSTLQSLHNQYHDLIEITDFSLPTWLAFGAAFHILLTLFLPPRVAALIPLSWLGWRLFKSAVVDMRRMKAGTYAGEVKRGDWNGWMPEGRLKEKGGAGSTSSGLDGVVCFILGARYNHPLGKLAPGMAEVDAVFKNMWREAEQNREKWGFLGKTAALFDSSDSTGTTILWVSYWRDPVALQKFAAGSAHLAGQINHEKKFPYLGIMHETYYAERRGGWESIYWDFPRWGLGTTKPVVGEEEGELQFADPLVRRLKKNQMLTRMGRLNTGELIAEK